MKKKLTLKKLKSLQRLMKPCCINEIEGEIKFTPSEKILGKTFEEGGVKYTITRMWRPIALKDRP